MSYYITPADAGLAHWPHRSTFQSHRERRTDRSETNNMDNLDIASLIMTRASEKISKSEETNKNISTTQEQHHHGYCESSAVLKNTDRVHERVKDAKFNSNIEDPLSGGSVQTINMFTLPM